MSSMTAAAMIMVDPVITLPAERAEKLLGPWQAKSSARDEPHQRANAISV